MDETQAILQAGNDDTFNAGKRRRAPLGSVDAAVVACRRQAANVTFAAVVIRRHSRIIKESEQFVAMLEQPFPNAHTVAIGTVAVRDQIVEAITDGFAGRGERGLSVLWAILTQLDRVLQQSY